MATEAVEARAVRQPLLHQMEVFLSALPRRGRPDLEPAHGAAVLAGDVDLHGVGRLMESTFFAGRIRRIR